MIRRNLLVVSIALFLASNGAQAAEEDLTKGLAAFNAKDYKTATQLFESYLKGKTPDSRTTYYLALSNYYVKNTKRAEQLFEYIVSSFPTSDEATNARKMLEKISPGYKPPAASTEKSASSPEASKKEEDPISKLQGRFQEKRLVHSDEEYKKEYAAIPEVASAPYRPGKYGKTVIAGKINGQDVSFVLTGGWETKVSVDMLKQWRIKPPEGKPKETQSSSSLGKDVHKWETTLDVEIGGVHRKVPATVTDAPMTFPAIGMAFFEDIKMELGQTALVMRKGSGPLNKGKKESIEEYRKEFAGLPDTAEIKYDTEDSGHMLVDAKINGRTIKCVFDTGANAYFGCNHLRQVGIPEPKGKPDSYSSGWAGKLVPTWKIHAKVQIGDLERTIPITVAKTFDMKPLLGQHFIRDYHYSIDSGSKRMLLTKKTAKGSQSSTAIHPLYDVPCEVKNDREYVKIGVSGAGSFKALIDTGASSTIMSEDVARRLNISIPANAATTMGGGVGGKIMFKRVYLNLKMGPIYHEDFPVMIGGHSGCAIGQNFMSGWRFTVDRERKLVRFFH